MERKQSELTVITKAKDLCSYVMTSTRLALTPVYLPYINRILGVNGYFGAKILRLLLFGSVFQGCCLRLRNAGKTPVCLSDDEVSKAVWKGGKDSLPRYSE